MAVRQYVGARYVPKFYQNSTDPSGTEWEGNRSYEALTVVSYNNDSYTSKIPVPAGIGNPAKNPTYWARTGAYNAQVEQYRQEAVKTEENITEQFNQLKTDTEQTVQTETTNRENTDNEIKESVQQVQEQANETQSNLTAEITERKTADNNLLFGYAKKYIIIGDSYATVLECGENNWANTLALILGTERCTIKSQGGAGFSVTGNSFLDLLKTVTANNEITDIIACGGANDFTYTIENNINSIKDFCTYALQNFPNAIVHIGMIGNSKPSFKDYAYNRTSYVSTIYAYKQLTGIPNAVYINGSEYLNLDMGQWKDQTHPIEEQSLKIGYGIYRSLKTGNAQATYADKNIIPTLTIGEGNMIIRNTFMNDELSVYIDAQTDITNINKVVGTDYIPYQYTTIATIGEDNYGNPYVPFSFETPVVVFATPSDGSTTEYVVEGQILILPASSAEKTPARIQLRMMTSYRTALPDGVTLNSIILFPNLCVFQGNPYLW